MIIEENIKEIQQYITLAANSLGWNDESMVTELLKEVERQINLSLQNESKMRSYVEAAYSKAAFIYSTGHSLLFYQRHDRQPIELKFCFKTDPEDIRTWIKQNKIKHINEKEYAIIIERLKRDTSKKICNSLCIGFWKSEKIASRYHMPVSFYGENLNYCDKSVGSRECD